MIWLLLAFLLLCSGAVSASETALFGLSRQALYRFGRSPGRLRRRVSLLMQQPRRVLMTVLITNTAVNVAIFTISFLALRELHVDSAALSAVGGVMVLLAVIVFGEMLPKALAFGNTGRFAPPAASLIAVLQLVLGPVRWILGTFLVEPITRLVAPQSAAGNTITTDELRLLVERSAHEGVIDSTENEMLQAIVALGDVSVREVMTPRVDIRWIRVDSGHAGAQRMIRKWRCRLVPACGRDLDDIRGILHTRDLYLQPEAKVWSLVRPVPFVPEQINLMQLLRYFRTEGTQMVIVVDEYGGTAGLVTLEDVVEWVVGELPDTERPRPSVAMERIDEDTYRLSGDLSVRLWADRFGAGEIDRHIDTVAGLILAKLGRLPRPGDSVRIQNLTLTVETMQRRRIERVLLRRQGNGMDRPEAER